MSRGLRRVYSRALAGFGAEVETGDNPTPARGPAAPARGPAAPCSEDLQPLAQSVF